MASMETNLGDWNLKRITFLIRKKGDTNIWKILLFFLLIFVNLNEMLYQRSTCRQLLSSSKFYENINAILNLKVFFF